MPQESKVMFVRCHPCGNRLQITMSPTPWLVELVNHILKKEFNGCLIGPKFVRNKQPQVFIDAMVNTEIVVFLLKPGDATIAYQVNEMMRVYGLDAYIPAPPPTPKVAAIKPSEREEFLDKLIKS